MSSDKRRHRLHPRLVLAGLALMFQASLAAAEPASPVRLADGESHAFHFTSAKAGEPQLLWLRGKISLPEGEKEGAHALQVKLNGVELTPRNSALLNTKQMVYDQMHKGASYLSTPKKIEVWVSQGAEPLADGESNFAQGKPTAASSGDASKLVNGVAISNNAGWSSDRSSVSSWCQVDLEGIYPLSHVRVAYFNFGGIGAKYISVPKKIEVWVSQGTDPLKEGDFTKISTFSGTPDEGAPNDGKMEQLSLPAGTKARFVRLKFPEGSKGAWPQSTGLDEMEVVLANQFTRIAAIDAGQIPGHHQAAAEKKMWDYVLPGGSTARFVRLKFPEGGTRPGDIEGYPNVVQIDELEVYNQTADNLALGKDARVSSTYSAGFPGTFLTDGKKFAAQKCWASAANSPSSWCQVDLGAVVPVKRLEIAYGIDAPRGTVFGSIPAYDRQARAWYLKADSDYMMGNAPDASSLYHLSNWADRDGIYGTAVRSHYYEYLWQPDSALIRAGDNVLELTARLPKRLRENSVDISAIVALPVRDPLLVYALPVTRELVYPWQAPSVDKLVASGQGLKISAAPGEREPLSFSVYGLQPLSGLTFDIQPFQRIGGGKERIEPANIQTFHVEGIPCPVNWTLDYGSPYVYPTLLKPLPAGGLTLDLHRSQRFVADVHVPDNLPAGQYESEAVIRAGETVLRRIPLRLEVYPFQLAAARQKYWMWRMQWTPIDEPDNIACLQDIKDHGFDGLAQMMPSAAGFKVAVNADNSLSYDASQWETLKRVLEKTGLSMRINDQSVIAGAFAAACKLAGISPVPTDQWMGENALVDPYNGQIFKPEDNTNRAVREKLPQIRQTMIQIAQKAREEAERIGLDLRIYPVDEPDGRGWRRAWVRFVADIAHAAGLKVWNTHNWPLTMAGGHWESGIDESCMNTRIYQFYANPEVVSGTLPFDPRSLFGQITALSPFPGLYGLEGIVDEVRFYNRPLSDEEILRQHEQPAQEGLLAYYPLDEGAGNVANDASGHDAAVGNEATWTDGRKGKAVRTHYQNKNDRVTPPTVTLSPDSQGWSISMWYKGSQGFPFASNYQYYFNGAQMVFRWPTQAATDVYSLGVSGDMDAGFWFHVTMSVDFATRKIKAKVVNDEQRAWYQQNIKWVYNQARGTSMGDVRLGHGISTWYARHLDNITVFGYDLNPVPTSHNCMVYPEDFDRNANRPNTKWYGSLGWLALREGIDDARYMQTLFLLAKERNGGDEEKAWKTVQNTLAPLKYPELDQGHAVIPRLFGSWEAMRRKLAREIVDPEHKLKWNEE